MKKTKETNLNEKNVSNNNSSKTTRKVTTKKTSTSITKKQSPEVLDKKSNSAILEKEATSNLSNKKSSTVKSQSKAKTAKKVSSTSSSKSVKTSSKNTSAATSKSTKKVRTTSKKSTTKTDKSSKFVSNVEYYDLPYRYNQTIVKILAQTPTSLFVYWDISDEDRDNYKKQFGDSFFETTHPVLVIHNDSLNYSFEININDFANSWYLKVNDSNCDYRIELGRRPNSNNTELSSNYIYISSSNEIKAPNDHILFDKNQKMIYFKNVKTNDVTAKDATQLSFIQNMGKVYNIYDLYKKVYADEKIEGFSNPSSQFK